MSDPYLYYISIKDTCVCDHLDFNCLKLKYEVNYDILLFILAPGYTVSAWGCVVLTVYEFMTGTGVKQLPDTQVNFLPIWRSN